MYKNQPAGGAHPVIKPKHKKPRKNRHKRKNKQKCQGATTTTGFAVPATTPSSAGLSLWTQTYENIVRWHSHHQMYYWKTVAEKFQRQNLELMEKLRKYESDSDSEEDEEVGGEDKDDIDEGYLKFMEVTNRHREDLRLQRLEAAESDVDVYESAMSAGMTEMKQIIDGAGGAN